MLTEEQIKTILDSGHLALGFGFDDSCISVTWRSTGFGNLGHPFLIRLENPQVFEDFYEGTGFTVENAITALLNVLERMKNE